MMLTTLERGIRTDSPIATRGEVAALVNVPAQRISQWSTLRAGRAPMVHTVHGGTRFTVPLVGIAETASLEALRASMSMQQVRKAADFIRNTYGDEYAMASKRLLTDGTDAFIEDEYGIARLRDGQGAWREVLREHLRPLIMGPDGFVEAFRVEQFTNSDVTIDPRFNAGRMSFTRNRVPVFTVAGALEAGEELGHVADDFGLTIEEANDVARLSGWLATVT